MAKRTSTKKAAFGAKTRPVDLSKHFNWPRRTPRTKFWKYLRKRIGEYPTGEYNSWGIPFELARSAKPRAIVADQGSDDVVVRLGGRADHLCFLHQWEQVGETARPDDPREGLLVGEYKLTYTDGSTHVQPIRARFEVGMLATESPGPAWLAVPCTMWETADPTGPVPDGMKWGLMQYGMPHGHAWHRGNLLVYAMPNPCPGRRLRSLRIRARDESPIVVAGLTLYQGADHPLRHLPRRAYRVRTKGKAPKIKDAQVDLGLVARTEHTPGRRGKSWLARPGQPEPEGRGEDVLHIVGAPDATVSVELDGDSGAGRHDFSLGEAFHGGRSQSGRAALEVLGRTRQWMQVRVIDRGTGRPTPVRIHFSGPRGEYIAPYGHHEQINTNWFEEYGADVAWDGRNYAYVPGEFTTDMPVGEVYVEICKGFEYAPVRRKLTIRPGQRKLDLRIGRWTDLRKDGWITADTHVHFISPQTCWIEGQAEGINVVNLLATQLGRLFTNVGDFTGRVGVVADDTIVYVGTENRHHMLGHMSLLGTKGQPVFPMCCGGPGESWVGDPEFMTMAEWALENRRKGGVVIRPHFPNCGHTEDPVPILKGLVDAVELGWRDAFGGFNTQEWYRYLNCGQRVAVVGGTDKMGAYCALGWLRTYAKLDPSRKFTYARWAAAVRAGRTFSTNGPLIDLTVDGRPIGDAISMSPTGGTVEVEATASCFHALGALEIVRNGKVVAATRSRKGVKRLRLRERVHVGESGWIAARCHGPKSLGGASPRLAAHTSPVYVTCGSTRAFDGPAAEHMLALVEGGMEYLNTIATLFDEPSRKRMVKMWKEVQQDLKCRLVVEAKHTHHHGDGPYHTHGHGSEAGHTH